MPRAPSKPAAPAAPAAPVAPGPERRRDAALAGAAAGALAACVALAAAAGEPAAPGDSLAARLAAVAWAVATAGAPAAAYLLAALGLGRALSGLWARAGASWSLQLGAGLALLLTLSHAMGWAGLLGLGPLVAGAPLALGLAMLAGQLLGASALERARIPLSPALLPALPGAAVLLVACASPPGWLWGSEFGGYDALSYHLQLPREWLRLGRLEPLGHNVYSFLPGYVEAAYMHLGALLGAGPGRGDLSAGPGTGLLSCQYLHGGMALCAALLCGRAAAGAAGRCGLGPAGVRAAGGAAFSLVLLTPWTVVTGSLAYNEHAMLTLGAAALIGALQEGVPAGRRGVLVGLLVGAACGAKPTALLFVGVPAGVLMLGSAAPRRWAALAGPGAAAGVLALAPWMARNELASGNPLFPFGAGVLGSGHWTAEQVETFRSGHRFEGTTWDALRLAVMTDTSNPARPEHRGLFHRQWGLFFPAMAASGLAALWWRSTRRMSVLLGAGAAAQFVTWLAATHVQSRFLMPMLLPGSMLAGVAAGGLAERGKTGRWAGPAAAGTVAAAQAILLLVVFTSQNHRRPNQALAAGVGAFNGSAYRAAFAAAPAPERARFLADASPEVFVNLALPAGAGVYLLGDATPLYFRPPVLYHTTWDASPLGQAMRRRPGDPGAWTAELRARGVEYVLVNLAELRRLHKSGWYDPLVTPDAVVRWVDTAGVRLREWPLHGRALFRLGAPEGGP